VQSKTPLYLTVAEKLRSRIRATADKRLPTFGSLCREYGVSLKTVTRAVHVLRDAGTVELTPGTAAVVRRPGAAHENEERGWGWEPAGRDLYRKIRRTIESGAYRTGHSLPKVKYYTVTERVTERTVCAAFSMLREANLIHKKGKSWIVGPATKPSGGRSRAAADVVHSPVVLVVVPRYRYWREFFDEHPRVFMTDFLTTLRHHDVQFVVVQAEETVGALPRSHPQGRKETAAMIGRLGKRYQGAIVASTLPWFPDIDTWLRWLVGFGKPVLWFDFDNSAPGLDRRVIPSPRYVRLYSDIDTAVETALQSLRDMGHTRIGVEQHGPYARHPWSTRRIQSIQRVARLLQPPLMPDIVLDRKERLWRDYPGLVRKRTVDEILFRFARSVDGGLRKQRPPLSAWRRRRALCGVLLDAVPSLTGLVSRGCTALVALNQSMAVCTFDWLRLVGLDVPADISLISFDDYLPLANHPISTVDFGFSNLGYQAAHIFIGDIPVRTDRWGNVAGKPRLVDRGSLGPPRRVNGHCC